MAARQDPVLIEAAPALQRGDIRIKFDGTEIDDLLDRRIGLSQPVASPPAENIETAADQQNQRHPQQMMGQSHNGAGPLNISR